MSEGGAGPPVRDGAARVVGVLFWIVVPVLCVLVLLVTGSNFAHNINRQPTGIRGTFTVTDRTCFGNVCQNAGTFRSDDGRTRQDNLLGDYRWKIGETHRAVLGRESGVIALPSRWIPSATVYAALGAVVLLGFWAWAWASERGRRRVRPGPPV